jgi:methyl-accepting chemotaxis protein
MFVEESYAASPEYAEFWKKLRKGDFDRGEYRRIAKGGKTVWLLASYNPVFDAQGKLLEIVKFATDVTAEKLRTSDSQGQIDAIHRVQGVIEFDLQGIILTANPIFLNLMGYRLEEVVGKHHSIFVEPGHEATQEYREFWANLRAGRPDARVYKRFGKHGKQVWIQASYNPILDVDGRPWKVVKFAADLTEIINQTETTQTTAHTVATATEEMSAAIAEISRNMDLSRGATQEIRRVASESGAEASHLVTSVKAMEKIATLIRSIAGQVNMLALNATIEAARAGEAGKGFAVVAGEVKNLSNQTAHATDEIGKEISSVQAIASRVAESIQQTMSGVAQVEQYVGSTATAMEEQTSVTREISEHSSRLVSAVEAILESTKRQKNAAASAAWAA